MSVIIAVYTPTGIVISGDSRTTKTVNEFVTNPQNPNQQINIQKEIPFSDTTLKVFSLFGKFGVGISGTAFIDNLPIAHYIEQFEIENHANSLLQTPNDLVTELISYFRQFEPIPNIVFTVAGYDKNVPFVFTVDISSNKRIRRNCNPEDERCIWYGVTWDGDTNIINRLLSGTTIHYTMNLQDGIDFSRHLIRTTINQMKFEPVIPTVGGEIDTLVITTDKTEFISKKKLTCK